jgi:hypothetical protein
MEVLIAGCFIISIGLYVTITGTSSKNKKEKFTRRINNLQPIQDGTSDEHTWQRTKSYYRDNPLEYNYMNVKEPEERPPVNEDFKHNNEVPFFKKEPYHVYKDEASPFLDRYSGDRPKKETIAPLYDKGQNHYLDKNEIQLGRIREQEEMDLYKNNFHTHNSKQYEFVGGDPVRVGSGIGNGYSADPQGGFQELWRQKELTYEELTGETRPDFDNAVRVPGLKGHVNLTVDEWAGEQTKNTKPATVFRGDGNQCNVQPGKYKKSMERADKIILKQQKTLNTPDFPYNGPKWGHQYGTDIDDDFNEDIQPKPVKYDIAAKHTDINYYHPTANPGYYERTDEVYPDGDKAKILEKYANYKLVDTKVQRHIYKDYDDYEWNDMKTGNEFVCVSRGGIISATKNNGTTVEAHQHLSTDTSGQHQNERETYLENERENQQEDVNNNNKYISVSEYTKNEKHANGYRVNNRVGNINSQQNGKQGGYSVINQNLRNAYKTNAFMQNYKGNAGNAGNNNGNDTREYMKTMNVNESKNTISENLINRSKLGRKQEGYHMTPEQQKEEKQKLMAYTNIKNNVFSGHSRQEVQDNRSEQMQIMNKTNTKKNNTAARNDFNIRRHTLAL